MKSDVLPGVWNILQSGCHQIVASCVTNSHFQWVRGFYYVCLHTPVFATSSRCVTNNSKSKISVLNDSPQAHQAGSQPHLCLYISVSFLGCLLIKLKYIS